MRRDACLPAFATVIRCLFLLALVTLVGACRAGALPTRAVQATVPASPTALAAGTATPRPTLRPSSSPQPTATATVTRAATSTATATIAATGTATSTATNTATATATTPVVQPYLSHFRLISYYGSAEGAGMGILNFRDEPELVSGLWALAEQYQTLAPALKARPTLHVIVTIADPWFGDDRNFNHRASLEAIEAWLAFAKRESFAVVLDVQPGHAPLLEEFERIRPYLYDPDVHLALDSEFTMHRTRDGLYQVPGETLGSLYAAQINPIQEALNTIAAEIGVNKVLILHQFEDVMLPDKEGIVDYPYVELVVDADGFGGPDKVRDYLKYANEPGFEYGGIKLYRNWDNPLLAPADVLALTPAPHVVIYQ